MFGRSASPDVFPPRERSGARTFVTILLWIFHFILIVFSVAVAALYGTDLNKGSQEHIAADGRWVYAVVVAVLTVVTNLVYCIPIKTWMFTWPWDFILFFLWVVLTGIFGSMYAKEDPEANGGIKRMKNAVYVDAIALIFSFFVAVVHLTLWIRYRQRRTIWTGAAPA